VTYVDSNGNTGSATTNSKGWYAFDSAAGPIPAAGPVTLNVGASGYQPLSVPRLVQYNDNPKASLANLSSFWDVQRLDLTPSTVPTITADMAVTDLYPDTQPSGTLWATITNNGPDALVNASLQLWCEAVRTDTSSCNKQTLGPLTVTGIFGLNPGQSEIIGTAMGLDTAKYWYEATCIVQTLQGSFSDSNSANDSYTEIIPPPTGDLELQDIRIGWNTNEVGILVQSSGSAGGTFCWTVYVGSSGHSSCGNAVPAGSLMFWTGDFVTGTQSVSASVMACSPETNGFNNQLVETCSSASHSCW
jgi:hypothetical protein